MDTERRPVQKEPTRFADDKPVSLQEECRIRLYVLRDAAQHLQQLIELSLPLTETHMSALSDALRAHCHLTQFLYHATVPAKQVERASTRAAKRLVKLFKESILLHWNDTFHSDTLLSALSSLVEIMLQQVIFFIQEGHLNCNLPENEIISWEQLEQKKETEIIKVRNKQHRRSMSTSQILTDSDMNGLNVMKSPFRAVDSCAPTRAGSTPPMQDNHHHASILVDSECGLSPKALADAFQRLSTNESSRNVTGGLGLHLNEPMNPVMIQVHSPEKSLDQTQVESQIGPVEPQNQSRSFRRKTSMRHSPKRYSMFMSPEMVRAMTFPSDDDKPLLEITSPPKRGHKRSHTTDASSGNRTEIPGHSPRLAYVPLAQEAGKWRETIVALFKDEFKNLHGFKDNDTEKPLPPLPVMTPSPKESEFRSFTNEMDRAQHSPWLSEGTRQTLAVTHEEEADSSLLYAFLSNAPNELPMSEQNSKLDEPIVPLSNIMAERPQHDLKSTRKGMGAECQLCGLPLLMLMKRWQCERCGFLCHDHCLGNMTNVDRICEENLM